MTTETETPTPPYLVFFPYLTMAKPVEFAGWWLGPVGDFEGDWPNERFRELAIDLMGAFRDADDNIVERPAILASAEGAIPGELPDSNLFLALQRTIHFGSLCRNPPWSAEAGNEGWWTSTSDNSEIVAWPIDLDQGRVTVARGSMVRIQAGGYTIGDDLIIRAPLELHLPQRRAFDDEVLESVYRVLTEENLGNRDFAHRIGVSIDWLAHAWRNSRSITFANRTVMLKTAFDALTATDKTHRAAAWIESMYCALKTEGVNDEMTEHLLWTSSEEKRHVRHWGDGQSEDCTDLVHWFHSFGEARNEIVHDGLEQNLVYEVDGSAYNGPFVNTGERLLRETITVCLRDFGFEDIWQPEMVRFFKNALGELL